MSKLLLVLSLLLIAAPSIVYADMPGFTSTGKPCKIEGGKDPCLPMATCHADGQCK